jgi:hypothetical protein
LPNLWQRQAFDLLWLISHFRVFTYTSNRKWPCTR